jgi:ABC-type nitrate/sulfonate/bicarbonate transport system substrate-binding protein
MTKRAAQKAYAKAGIKPSDVQVVELHGKEFVFKLKNFTHGIIF